MADNTKYLDKEGLQYFYERLQKIFPQETFSNVKVGTTTVSADGKTGTLELEAGTNITLTPDAKNDKITITAAGGGFSGDYEKLENKPKINNVTLTGNKSGKQLSLIDSEDLILEYEIDAIVYGGLN